MLQLYVAVYQKIYMLLFCFGTKKHFIISIRSVLDITVKNTIKPRIVIKNMPINLRHKRNMDGKTKFPRNP